jgi:hypothetical protein
MLLSCRLGFMCLLIPPFGKIDERCYFGGSNAVVSCKARNRFTR